MGESTIIDEYYQLWLMLSQTRAAIFKARDKKTGRYMPPNQAAALVIIWAFQGQATPTILSRYLCLERHSVSELISRMEVKGFVVKNKKLKKAVRIEITPKGQDICFRAMETKFIRGVMSSLSDEQREQLRQILQILLNTAREELGIVNLPLIPALIS
jgi:DNA-binding MarR family transcriptional regulator